MAAVIDHGFSDAAGRPVTLREVDARNWRAAADVAPRDEQREFVAALAARYLLLSLREGRWHSLAVCAGEEVVGHIMWARDDFDRKDGAYWIGGMVVDASEQGKRVGRAMLATLVAHLMAKPEPGAIRLSCHPRNAAARHLYTTAGFEPTGEMEDDEAVLELRRER